MDEETFAWKPLALIQGMMIQIRRREKRHAVISGWNSAVITSAVLASAGAKDLNVSELNPFLGGDKKTQNIVSTRGQRIMELHPAAAEGIVKAQEDGILPYGYWIGLAPMWYNIVETARFHRGD